VGDRELAHLRHIDNVWFESSDVEQNYMARVFVQATMPHSDPGNVRVWARRNGDYQLVINPFLTVDREGAEVSFGIPYGAIPRVLLTWISTEAVRTGKATILLGDSLGRFCHALGYPSNGGKTGRRHPILKQMRRMFSAHFSLLYDGLRGESLRSRKIAEGYDFYWHPQNPNQVSMWESTVTLDPQFFQAITEAPVPVDMRALRALRRSPMALDLYMWLTYRLSYLKKPTLIPWTSLAQQLGSDYGELRVFRFHVLRHVERLMLLPGWERLRLSTSEVGLTIHPGSPHVPKRDLL
jgi:hypothetical protein